MNSALPDLSSELPISDETSHPKFSFEPSPQPFFAKSGLFIGLALLMAVLKLTCAALTIGTNDVVGFYKFMVQLRTLNVCELYHRTILFNNPPLVASYLTILDTFASSSISKFAFFLRVPSILSDLVLALFIISQRRREPLASCPNWALALFIASPVAFLVSAFHGNFDSIVVLFMFLAAWMCVRKRPALSALYLAISLQFKVPAMIIMPVFLIYWYRQGALKQFAVCLTLLCAVGWLEPLARDPRIFVHNVFGYSSYWGSWGITYFLVHTASEPFMLTPLSHPTSLEWVITLILKVIIMSGITYLAWTQRPFTPAKVFPTLAFAWSLFFFLTPGAGVQYMVWLAPFVLLYHPRWYLGLTICSSIFCYFFYHIISKAWLLYFGNSTLDDYWVWGPWMLWGWVSSAYGMYLYWLEKRPRGDARVEAHPSNVSLV